MKTQLFRMSVFAVVTAAAVYAQNPRVGKVTIPFDFMMGTQTMAAGQYTVEHGISKPLLTLKSGDGKIRTVLTDSIESLDAQTVGKLVFHRYGSEYFLSEAWTPGSKSGSHLRTTSHERELAARVGVPTDTAVVAAIK
jgi:hypothetical protein